ncbi:unnamed protein product [Heterobilharzia americana]|nr:unnamed protein product [Heterobilharzia americana]
MTTLNEAIFSPQLSEYIPFPKCQKIALVKGWQLKLIVSPLQLIIDRPSLQAHRQCKRTKTHGKTIANDLHKGVDKKTYVVDILLSLLNGYSVIILLKVATIERFFPFNVMTLGVFTLFHSIIVAQITSEIAAFTEGLSFFFVLLTSTILFVFATRYSHDITNSFSQYFCLFTMPLAFIPIFIVIFAVEGFESILTKVFMGFTTIYFLLFTSITAQILQGSRFVEVDTQDYVLGSMQLFTEILCASLAMSTLLDGSSSEEYYWFTTIFLTFNIHLLYFFILVNAVELKAN